MKKKFYAFTITMLFGLMAFTTTLTAQVIRYVKAGAAGTGTSWANASGDLQAMINASTANDLVWVAKGTYYPTTSTTDRNASFALKDNVAIYGGFAGSENLLSQRDWRTNRTILSGDIDKNNTLDAGNSYHVFNMVNYALSSNAILDGFEIAGGYTNDGSFGGGGLFMYNAAALTEMKPSFVNCTFRDNFGGSLGGAVFLFARSENTPAGQVVAPSFLNCQFINNNSGFGGAIFARSSIISLTEVATTRPVFKNSIFLNNSVSSRGGAIYAEGSGLTDMTFINCSFLNNQSALAGGAIYTNLGGGNSNSKVNLTNSVFFGNGGSNSLFQQLGGAFAPQNCFFESSVTGYAGTNNIISDISPFQSSSNLQLVPASCAINTGDNAAIAGVATDLAGNNRIYNNGTVDIGAYEYQGDKQPNNYTPPATTSNNALNFDGTGDNAYIAAADVANCAANTLVLSDAITIEYWFKGTNIQSAVRFQNSTDYISAGWGTTPNFKHILSNSGGTDGVAVGAAATDGNWHHVAMTWQKGTTGGFKSYLDGQIVEQKDALNVALPSFSSGMFLGSFNGTGEFMNGTLDEVRVWNVARSQAELQAGMCGGVAAPQTGLLMYYKFDQGIANNNNTGINELLNSANPGVFSGYLRNFALNGTTSNWVSPKSTIGYVKQGGTGQGTSWADASGDLQAMINGCGTSQVWVAKGTYKPTTTTDRTVSFVMNEGVKIYGGFAGTETALSQRTLSVIAANSSILSGDLNGDDVITGSGSTLSITNNAENSYHVITNGVSNLTAAAVLDGFTITGGNTVGSSIKNGGGMYLINSSPIITNCSFSGNSATIGGGMYITSSSASLIPSPSLSNVVFSRNLTTSAGGGMSNFLSSPTLINVIFSGNNAGANGGGMYNSELSAPSLINVTFSGNNTSSGGGGMAYIVAPTIQNSIFWGNTRLGTIVNNIISGPPITTVTYSDIQGGFAGTGNINVDPQFVNAANPAGADGVFGTADDGLAPTACSPALNAGNNTGVAATDIAGNPRIFNTTVDMGAYELQSAALSSPARLYVNASAAGANSGLSWADAFTDLQAALNYSCKSNLAEIWVAKGTYKPTTTSDRTIFFTMQEGVKIYGGFAGTETALSQRTFSVMAANPSILSGDLLGNDVITGTGSTLSIANNAENSLHVIYNNGNNLSAAAVLDGFIITGGNAISPSGGGGIYLLNSAPTITNCTFSGNSAYVGGALYNSNFNRPSPSYNNLTFSGNLASYNGGGMYNSSSSPAIINCSFSGNKSLNSGGGMFNTGSSPSLNNVTFSGNYSSNLGGGVYNVNASSPNLKNVIFSGNAGNPGGGFYNESNCYPTINNTIFWGNTSNGNANIKHSDIDYSGGSINISYSALQLSSSNYTTGFIIGAGMLYGIDPFFVNAANAAGADGIFGTADDGLALMPYSCAINAGSNAAVAGINTDLAGNPRIYNNGTVDMGAYEYQGDKQAYIPPAITTTNNALNFDGTNDYVSLSTLNYNACASSGPLLSNAITIEYWFKGSNIQSAVRFQDANGYISAGWNGNTTNPYTHILSNDGGAANGIPVGAAATDGNWHHIAMTWQQGAVNGFKSYLDGALVAQRDALNTPLPSISGLYLGSYNGTAEFTNGSLDEVRVWSIARSQADIQSGMCGGVTTPQTGLLMYYTFDHGAANGSNAGVNMLLNNASPNQFTGTLQNFALTGTGSNWVPAKTLPAAPTSGGNQVQCAQSPMQTLTATAIATGGTIVWYDAAIAGNLVASPTLSAIGTVTYYAQAFDGTCGSLTRTPVTLTINTAQSAPVSGGNQVACAQSPIQTLTAAATGGTIVWYDAASGGNVVASPTLNTVGTVTYYAQAFDGTCNSLTRTPVILTINTAQSAPVSGGNQVACAQSPIQTLTATATGGTIVWYDAASAGNVVASPTLNAIGTVTYYAQSSNSTCNSLTRTPVTLTINTAQSVPVSGGNQIQCAQSPIQTLTATATGGTIVWYDAASGGNIVANPTLNTIGTVTYYAQSSGGTCSSLTRTAVTLTINTAQSAPVSGGNQVACAQSPIQTLTATATGGTIVWYDAASAGNVVASPTLNTIGTVTYYAQSSGGTCSSTTRTAVALTINPAPAAPVSGGDQTQSAQSPVQTLTAAATGGTITWYDAATAGNIVANPTLSAVGTVTYYAQSSNGTCSSLTRTAVKLTITPAVLYTITASAGANGTISPSGAVSVASGTNKTFTITPNAGYAVANVLVDNVSQGPVTLYMFSNVTAIHVISASFVTTVPTTSSNAGSNITIVLPTSSVTLDGRASTGNIAEYYWYQAPQQSPVPVLIGNNFLSVTTATGFTTPGTYVFGLQVKDNTGALYYSYKKVTVLPASANPVPACVTNTSPANASVLTTQTTATLTWPASATATSYDVYLQAGTGTPTTLVANTAALSYSANGLTAGTTYSWYIAPANASGPATTCGSSNKTTFTTAAAGNVPVPACVTNTSPANGTTIATQTTATLTWPAAATATSYYVYLAAGTGIPTTLVANTAALSYSASGLTAGTTYSWYIAPANASGPAATCGSSNKTIFTTAAAGNQPLASNAGSNVTITLPASSVALDGGASTGNIAQYYWYQAQGPVASMIANNLSSVTTATGLTTAGTYVFGLQVKDNAGGIAYSYKTVIVNPAGTGPAPACVTNTSPANASVLTTQTTATLTWPSSATATIYDVYLGAGTGIPTTLVANTASLNYSAGGLTAGTTYSWYIAPRNASGAATGCGTTNKTTFTTAGIQPFASNAGSNVTITLPTSSVALDGSASTGNIAQYYWYQAQGPVQSAIGNNFIPVTTASFTTAGTYVFGLQVKDNSGATAYAYKTVIVKAAGTREMDPVALTTPSLKADEGSSLPSVTAVISPNPVITGSQAKLQINSNKAGTVMVNIVSSNGAIIGTKKVYLVAGINTTTVNTAGLAQGFHIISISGAAKPLNLKLVIQ